MSEKRTITKRALGGDAPATGERRIWDDRLPGFCVRVYAATTQSPGGRSVYAVKYRVNGRQRWFTIGEHGQPYQTVGGENRPSLTPDLAREEATVILAEAKRGVDPQIKKLALRRSITVGELITEYLAQANQPDDAVQKRDESKTTRKRASSWATDRACLERHVRPILGKDKAGTLTKDDIERALGRIERGDTAADIKTKARGRARVTGGPGVVHRVLSTTRAMFNWAITKRGLEIQNPCAGVKLDKRPAKERFLSDDEAAELFEALQTLEEEKAVKPQHAAIFRLLLLTGARLDEIAALRWSEIDLERELITLPPVRTKSGRKTGTRHIHINSAALEILQGLSRAKGAVYAFPATKGKSGHTTTAPKVWRDKVRPAAKLAGVRLHDLRHSHASFALANGASIPEIAKALGHASYRSAERYAHLGNDQIRRVSEGVANRLGKKS